MGDLYVLQVVLEVRPSDSSPVRVHNVAFEKVEPPVVAETQIVRVPHEASIPPEERFYSSEYLRTYGFQSCYEIRKHCRVRCPQKAPHGRPRCMDRRANDGVGDVRAEPLDI